jgi:hypothetical protein
LSVCSRRFLNAKIQFIGQAGRDRGGKIPVAAPLWAERYLNSLNSIMHCRK